MARAKLNKSEFFLTNTTKASKYLPRRPRICINWNPLFQTHIFFIKCTSKCNNCETRFTSSKQFLKNLRSEVWKRGFQLMLILGLQGMYFDAAVVFVKKTLLLIRLALAILWCSSTSYAPSIFEAYWFYLDFKQIFKICRFYEDFHWFYACFTDLMQWGCMIHSCCTSKII